MTHSEAGAMGGLARAANNSTELRLAWSAAGGTAGRGISRPGRPRCKTLEQLITGKTLQGIKQGGKSEEMICNGNSQTHNLRTLKRLYLARRKDLT
jgi:hypothetical protein